MIETVYVFQRIEKKYLLSVPQYKTLENILIRRLSPDAYGLQTIANVYYDTPDYCLIRESLNRPIYKEKLRLRSYGIAQPDSEVFVEIKKKFKGIVYKRREVMRLKDAETFLRIGVLSHTPSQIQKEIEYFRQLHPVIPMAFIAYDRQAYFDPQGGGLRLTFDTNIRCRDEELTLCATLDGQRLLGENRVLMEVKTRGAMPLWLSKTLSDLSVFPSSFSKYGNFYMEQLSQKKQTKRGLVHVA